MIEATPNSPQFGNISPDTVDLYMQLAGSSEPLTMDKFADEDEARGFVNWCLQSGYNDQGVEQWWGRRRERLDGLSPTEAWPDAPETVIGLAGWLVNRCLDSTE